MATAHDLLHGGEILGVVLEHRFRWLPWGCAETGKKGRGRVP